jgi:glucose/arabinose dehydrogenase
MLFRSTPFWRLATLLLVASTTAACAAPPSSTEVIDSKLHRFRVETLLEGLEHPWALAFLPDGSMLISERPGRLRWVVKGQRQPYAVTGLPEIAETGQGGLLDVATHPDFAANRLIYFTYAGRGPGGIGTELARARLNDNGALEDLQVLFVAEPKSSGGRHFGSRIVFDDDGTLYFGVGERGDMDRAQDLSDHAGSIIRLAADGSLPPDNPFASRPGARPEIYAYGIRNPQGLARHPDTGALWEHEHGPRGGDEVNIIRAGANYGWPVITYGIDYSGFSLGEGTEKPGMEQPIHYWDPSIAPSGMAFYQGDAFPHWRGNLLVGALKDQMLVRLQLDGTRVVAEEHLLQDRVGRIRDVRVGPDGLVYLLTDDNNGKLLRLRPAD